MTKRKFIEQYVLNAALGAGQYRLSITGTLAEARAAWDAIVEIAPEDERPRFSERRR